MISITTSRYWYWTRVLGGAWKCFTFCGAARHKLTGLVGCGPCQTGPITLCQTVPQNVDHFPAPPSTRGARPADLFNIRTPWRQDAYKSVPKCPNTFEVGCTALGCKDIWGPVTNTLPQIARGNSSCYHLAATNKYSLDITRIPNQA